MQPLGLFGQVSNEADWIRLRCRALQIVIETYIGVAGRITYLPRQRGLATLARPMDEHHGCIGQGLSEARKQETTVKSRVWPNERLESSKRKAGATA